MEGLWENERLEPENDFEGVRVEVSSFGFLGVCMSGHAVSDFYDISPDIATSRDSIGPSSLKDL